MNKLYTCILSFFVFALSAQDTSFICLPNDLDIQSLAALNTKSIEFSPVFYQEGLVFVVARERNRIIDPKTGQAFFDLMYADVGPSGNVTRPENFSPNIRTQYHEGPCTFNKQQNEIFYTSSNIVEGAPVKGSKQKNVFGKIIHGIKGEDDWEQLKELPFSSNTYSCAHPALSADGRWLVFSSDMPGGFGGMDLYVVERVDGQWMAPVNLGSTINSKGNEAFPFWHESGYLFFSTDGHSGFGGFDFYVTLWSAQKSFKGIQHLLFPYNSGRDDLGFIVSDDGKSGYFASDRKPTKGKDDLYQWSSETSIFCAPIEFEPALTVKELLVTNENAEPVSTAYVWMIPMGPEGPLMHRENFSTELVA